MPRSVNIQDQPHTLLLSLPDYFIMKDLSALIEPVCRLKMSPGRDAIAKPVREWFKSICAPNEEQAEKYFNTGKYDLLASISFPNAKIFRLEECLRFLMWAFSSDDITDGELLEAPQEVQNEIDKSMNILHDENAPRPSHRYAAMLYDLLSKMRATSSSPTAVKRFCIAVEQFCNAEVEQSDIRMNRKMQTFDEFLIKRRILIGGELVSAMVQYALDLDIPDNAMNHPSVRNVIEALSDLMAYPNDLCSFNKEQADGDLANMVFIVMGEQKVDLQTAVDILTEKMEARAYEHVKLKQQVPSFGQEVDVALATYFENFERFVQGHVTWLYLSPRYFPPAGIEDRTNLKVTLYQRSG